MLMMLLTIMGFSAMAQDHFSGVKSDAPLQNTRWKLVGLAGFDTLPSLRKDAWIQFTLQDNRFRGNTGCNNVNGVFSLKEGNQLTLGPLAMTRMACPEPMMKVEHGMTEALGNFNGHTIHGDTLILMKDGKMLARFEALYLR